jgi:hypothetical protein
MFKELNKSLKFIKFKENTRKVFSLFFFKPILFSSLIIFVLAYFGIIDFVLYFIVFIAFFCLFLFLFWFFGGSDSKDFHGGTE